jgi:cell division protein FtsL
MTSTSRNGAKGNRRPKMKMARRPFSRGLTTLLTAVFLTCIGLAWVWRLSWYEQISNQFLALEKQEGELQNESGNLRQQLLQASQYTKVEALARQKLGMIFPNVAPDTVWTEAPTEQPSLGAIAFLAPLSLREKPSSRHQ